MPPHLLASALVEWILGAVSGRSFVVAQRFHRLVDFLVFEVPVHMYLWEKGRNNRTHTYHFPSFLGERDILQLVRTGCSEELLVLRPHLHDLLLRLGHYPIFAARRGHLRLVPRGEEALDELPQLAVVVLVRILDASQELPPIRLLLGPHHPRAPSPQTLEFDP